MTERQCATSAFARDRMAAQSRAARKLDFSGRKSPDSSHHSLHGSSGRTARRRTLRSATNPHADTFCVRSRGAVNPSDSEALARHDEDTRLDRFLCLCRFLADFFVRFHRAPSKVEFLKWGWIDFVSSIPMLNLFRVGRVVRIIRVFRILRAFRSMKNLITYFLQHRKVTSFAAVAAISLCVMVFCTIAVLNFEDSPESNIKNAGDAFWWAFVTMTTVGYGDKYPLSAEGRVIACILMTAGAGLFATLTGFVASMFLQSKTTESELQELTREVRALGQKVEALTMPVAAESTSADATARLINRAD